MIQTGTDPTTGKRSSRRTASLHRHLHQPREHRRSASRRRADRRQGQPVLRRRDARASSTSSSGSRTPAGELHDRRHRRSAPAPASPATAQCSARRRAARPAGRRLRRHGGDTFTIGGIGALTTVVGGGGDDTTIVSPRRGDAERHPQPPDRRRHRRAADVVDDDQRPRRPRRRRATEPRDVDLVTYFLTNNLMVVQGVLASARSTASRTTRASPTSVLCIAARRARSAPRSRRLAARRHRGRGRDHRRGRDPRHDA